MTINELFSTIGKNLGEVFYYLGNTPIEDLFFNLIMIAIGGLILVAMFWLFILIKGFSETLFYKIFPDKSYEKVPLEKQSMYIMGKKIKNFFSKKKRRKRD